MNCELKKILLVLACLCAGWGCRAQILYQKVMVGDSLTNITLGYRMLNGTSVPHVGPMRRGHATIDWTLKGTLVIPPEVIDYDGTCYPIRIVGFHSFYKCVGLTEVTLPPTVRLLCYEAFYGCNALTEVRLSDSLLVVGERSFSGCSSLRRITVPCAVPPRCAADAFDSSTFQEATVVVPKGCRAAYQIVEPWCRFARMEEGEEVAMPTPTTDIDYWLHMKDVMETTYEDEHWRMPQRVEDDAMWTMTLTTDRGALRVAFSTRRAYDMAVVGSGMANECCIDSAFAGWLALPDSVTAPDGRRYVVGGVAMNAFSGCRRLLGVDMPSHLEFIDNYAFLDCKALRQVTIPAGMKEIMSSAFVGCQNLDRVEVLGQQPPDLFVDAFDDRTFNTATLIVPDGAMEVYMATDAWPLFRYRMENVEF